MQTYWFWTFFKSNDMTSLGRVDTLYSNQSWPVSLIAFTGLMIHLEFACITFVSIFVPQRRCSLERLKYLFTWPTVKVKVPV